MEEEDDLKMGSGIGLGRKTWGRLQQGLAPALARLFAFRLPAVQQSSGASRPRLDGTPRKSQR
jgi:hypothetical protein